MLKVSLEESAYVIRDSQTFLPLATIKYGRWNQWLVTKVTRAQLEVALDHYRSLLLPGVADEVLTIVNALEMGDTHCFVADVKFKIDALGLSESMRYVLCSEHQFDSRVEVTLHIIAPFMTMDRLVPQFAMRY